MTHLQVLFLGLVACLQGCGDDLSGLPSPEKKAIGSEPESFIFEQATYLDPSSIYIIESSNLYKGASVYSRVPAGNTRYYYIDLDYFDAGMGSGDLHSVKILSGGLNISLYDADRNLIDTSADQLSFSTSKSYFPDSCYECTVRFYVAVENDSQEEVDYSFQFYWIRGS